MSLFRDALDRRCRALTEVIHATYIRAHSVSLDILGGAGADRARCLQLSALFSLCVHAFSCSVLTMVVNAAVAGIALVAAAAQPASWLQCDVLLACEVAVAHGGRSAGPRGSHALRRFNAGKLSMCDRAGQRCTCGERAARGLPVVGEGRLGGPWRWWRRPANGLEASD